jgi:hypothetical protein
MVAPTSITPGWVQFLENKKRFHTTWVNRVDLAMSELLSLFPGKFEECRKPTLDAARRR